MTPDLGRRISYASAMSSPDERVLSPAEVAALDRQMTYIARAVAGAFTAVAAVTAGIGFVAETRRAGGIGLAAVSLAGTMFVLGAGAGLGLGGILWLLSYSDRARLFAGPLMRGQARIINIARPGPDGGSTQVSLEIVFLDGTRREGHLRLHGAWPEGAVDQELTVWIEATGRSFLVDGVSCGYDPGRVQAPRSAS